METNHDNKYRLQDLIDIKHFQNLQNSLSEIYSFPSAIIDIQGNILTSTAWRDICGQFHRKNKECEKACLQSNKYILEHLHEANPAVTYHCSNGMVDTVAPIIIEGVHYGNFFTGQFFFEKPDMDFFKEQAKKYGFPEGPYLEAVKKVPIWTKEQLNSYLCFIKGLIDIISESALKNLKGRETRKLIEESERRYKAIIQTAMDGFCLVDIQGRLLEVNDTYCEMSGFSRQELLNMRIYDLEADESPDKIAKNIQDIIEKGSDRFTRRQKRKDGSLIDVELSIQYQPEEERFFCFLRDITEHNRKNKELREREEQLRSIFMAADEVSIILTDDKYPEPTVLEFSHGAENIFGYTRKEMVGNHISVLHSPGDIIKIEEAHKKMRKGGKGFSGETTLIRKSGKKFPALLTTYPLFNENGTMYAALGVSIDITKQKDLETQLQHTQKMESIGTLAGGIAHDFNNLLSPIMLHSEMIMSDLSPDDPLQLSMNEIYKASERARDLVQQILTFARKRPEKKIVLKSSLIIKEAIQFLRSSIPSTIDIQYYIKTEQDTVLADPTQINQIIMNLSTNAAHAMREKGGLLEITLNNKDISSETANRFGALKPGRYLKLSVRDTGSGMPSDIIEKIFEPYYTTKEPGEGTGLGLATIHGIVQNYGGDIRVKSKIGQGTIFYVYLPLVNTEISSRNKNKVNTLKGTERILLVDDEKVAVNVMCKMLEILGYKVTARTSSIEALEAFHNAPDSFDLVITDMTMPNMTGDDLAKELMVIKPGISIILCTGFSDKINEKKAKAMGISSFVMKPIVMSEMAKIIREVLD